MLAELAVIIIVLAMVAYQYLNGTLIKSFMMFISSIVGLTAAFGFFELLGGLIIGYGYIASWAMPICLILIFAIAFIITNTIAEKLLLDEIYFNDIIDRIGRSVFGVLTGFVIAGIIINAVTMMPIPGNWPYERFSAEDISHELSHNKTLILNADGFVAGLFSKLSSGAMRSKTSFASLHPAFTDGIHLAKLNSSEESNLFIAGKDAITVKQALLIEDELKSSDPENPIPLQASRGKAVIINVGINGKEVKQGGALDDEGGLRFTMAQFKLLCREKGQVNDSFAATQAVYPVGIFTAGNIVDIKQPAELLSYRRSELKGGKKWLDLVFCIPNSTVPVGLQFKLNSIAKVPTLKSRHEIAENADKVEK